MGKNGELLDLVILPIAGYGLQRNATACWFCWRWLGTRRFWIWTNPMSVGSTGTAADMNRLRLRDDGKTIFRQPCKRREKLRRVGILVSGRLAACDRITTLVGNVPKSVEVCATGLTDADCESLGDVVLQCQMRKEGGHRIVVKDVEAANAIAIKINQMGGTLISMVPAQESLEDFFYTHTGCFNCSIAHRQDSRCNCGCGRSRP